MRNEIQLLSYVQCPYSGGPAVYWARTLLNLLNDTLEYHDKDVCEIMGIYRLQNTYNENSNKQLKIFPNPSSGNVQFVYSGLFGSEINIEIVDVQGRLVYKKTVNNLSSTSLLQLSTLIEGLYSLKLSDNDGRYLITKLIINQ